MTQPSFSCPRCGYTTFLPSDVQAGYCAPCRWWTGDSLLGSEDVLAQAEIDGPFVGVMSQAALARLATHLWGETPREDLPESVYCREHDLYDCWYAHGEPIPERWSTREIDGGTLSTRWSWAEPATRAELEREWFADAPSAYSTWEPDRRIENPDFDSSPHGWPVHVAYDPAWSDPPPTFRVARFVEALRRLRRR